MAISRARLLEYLLPVLEQMSDDELMDYMPSLTYICQKLSERWSDEQLGEPRRDVAERYIATEIKRRKIQK